MPTVQEVHEMIQKLEERVRALEIKRAGDAVRVAFLVGTASAFGAAVASAIVVMVLK